MLVNLAAAGLAGLMISGFLLGVMRILSLLPPGDYITWVRGAALGWALASVGPFLALWMWRDGTEFNPARRRLMRVAGGAALAAPFAAGGYGTFVERTRLEVCEVNVPIAGLPSGLDGLRLAQLTDIHMGPFLSASELARAVAAANEWRAHIGLITGDLISDRGGPLDECLRILAQMQVSDGLYGCLGNHEGYARVEAYCAERALRVGIDFLRGSARELRFGGSRLNLAGVDYQRMGQRYLVGAGRLVKNDGFNVLLSHNPDVFPVAARQGFRLTIAGHTHGGQLSMGFAGIPLNVARFYTPYVRGLYREGRAALYVSRGIGTVGIPVRIGSPPEVTLIRLCAS